MTRTLTQRELNRATLARQMLLERADAGIVETVEFLGGLQAQQTHDPYIGLWTRLEQLSHEELTRLIVDRTLNRATTMRGTLHLHSVRDLYGFRALVQPFLTAQWTSGFRKRFGETDKAAVLRAGRKLLDQGPMTAGALGKLLRQKFDTAEALAMTTLLQSHDILVQIPPTRIWGSGHAPVLTRVQNWLPAAEKPLLNRTDLVRRYLRAYGPASINDMQTWCRLTKLSAEFKAMRDELVEFTDADGRTLYDFPDAPRPDGDTPAPVRFLPLYDNAYLGYDDRRRMLSPTTRHLINMFQAFKPAILVDGMIDAGWMIEARKGVATLEIEAYRTMTKRELAELEAEGTRLAQFLEPEADDWIVSFASRA